MSVDESFQVSEDMKKIIRKRLALLGQIFLIISLKGGVGKTTITCSLARNFSELKDKRVGLWDFDISNPSVHTIMGMSGIKAGEDGLKIITPKYSKNLTVMSVGFLLPSPDQPVVLTGREKSKLMEQFISSVDFGQFDYLVVDTPPTTSEELLKCLEIFPIAKTFIIFVSQPSYASINSTMKSIKYLTYNGYQVKGLIGNMTGHLCSHCGQVDEIFLGGEKLLLEMCQHYEIPYLGGVLTGVMKRGSKGELLLEHESFRKIANDVLTLPAKKFEVRELKKSFFTKAKVVLNFRKALRRMDKDGQ